MSPDNKPFHFQETYWASLRQLNSDDAHNLHELAVSVNWPHRPEDMDQLLKLGKGVLVSDEISRAIGAGMFFPMADDFAMVGMMMTRPRLQAAGMGREILKIIMDECGDRRLRLNSTTEARKLYRSAGFCKRGTVAQYQGFVNDAELSGGLPKGYSLRPVTAADTSTLLDLDLAGFGADRGAIFGLLMQRSEGLMLEKDGQVIGFALSRNFGRGRLIGPLVAPTEDLTIALIRPFVEQNRGKYLRMDTDVSHQILGAFLISRGLVVYDTVTPMTIADGPGPENNGGMVYALASQAMG